MALAFEFWEQHQIHVKSDAAEAGARRDAQSLQDDEARQTAQKITDVAIFSLSEATRLDSDIPQLIASWEASAFGECSANERLVNLQAFAQGDAADGRLEVLVALDPETK